MNANDRERRSIAQHHNNRGKELARAGQTAEAGRCFEMAVRIAPDFAEAHNNHALILKAQGRLDESIDTLRRAIGLDCTYAEAHYNLGNMLRAKNCPDDAATAYRRAIQLRPAFVEAHNNLGTVLVDLGHFQQACEVFRGLTRLSPASAVAWNNLGSALREAAALDEALAAIDRAVRIKPDYVNAHRNRGLVLKEMGRTGEALAALCRAVDLDPAGSEALGTVGNILLGQGRFGAMIDICKSVIARRGDSGEAHARLASALWHGRQLDEALAACQRALRIDPDMADAHNTLGNILRDRGELDAAVASFKRAVELRPQAAGYHGNLAYTVHFHPDYDSAAICRVNRDWAARYETPLLPAAVEHPNDRDPRRRLRVGYVSPDYRQHCASFFLLPLLAHHDPREIAVFCYSSTTQEDELTARFKALGHQWRQCAHLGDAALDALIRQDRIDILIDLSLHMSGGRLQVFARKPSPVQVTWLGYPSTTGLTGIDYRLTDPWLDPPEGDHDSFYSERSIRLPHSFWCYEPSVPTPEANELPAQRCGHVTFGCFNNFLKVTGATVRLWIKVMTALPDSRLVLLCPPGSHRTGFLGSFQDAGIAPGRIEFVSHAPMREYFGLYNSVDAGLDTLPYTGHTTTLDSLWMGVPVVTLAGRTSVGRGGVSILTNVGLEELIARSEEHYIDIMVRLMTDLPKLATLRNSLRQRLLASPLCDAPGFARAVESAYRSMWREYCQRERV